MVQDSDGDKHAAAPHPETASGVALGVGLVGAELQDTLDDEAVYARNPDERRREVRWIVRGLP